jgi:hypothetical protein
VSGESAPAQDDTRVPRQASARPRFALTRPPIKEEHRTQMGDDVRVELKAPWRNATTHVRGIHSSRPLPVTWPSASQVNLYVFLDVWSRKIVGWAVHERECVTLAAQLLADPDCRSPRSFVIHRQVHPGVLPRRSA